MPKKYDLGRHHRRSIRLKEYDYTRAGAYFLTLCTKGRACVLGEVVRGEVVLSEAGQVVEHCWNDLPLHYPHVRLDAFVVMPNHAHAIIVLSSPSLPVRGIIPKRHGLPEIVRGFKTFSSRHVNRLRGTPGIPLWQRNYYEHVVRGEDELDRIRQYIEHNPIGWLEDENYPERIQL